MNKFIIYAEYISRKDYTMKTLWSTN